jgi:hypothetical protein
MRTKRTVLEAVLIVAQAFWTLAGAATKQSVSHQIESAWFDSARVYLLYKKQEIEERYSLADVHGTISKDETSQWLISYSRSELRDGAVMQLKEGMPAESVIYEDADFSIGTVGRQATLSGRRMAEAVPVCERPETVSRPIRWNESLFYCGKFYSLSGNVVRAVPDAVLQSMTAVLKLAQEKKPGPLGSQGKLVFFIDHEGALLVARSLAVVSPLKVGAWPVDGKDVEWRTIAPGQPGQELFVANGVAAYSPNSIVLRDRADRWIRCQQSECKPVDKLSASGAFLLVDDQAGEAFALSLPNLTQPRLLVHSIRF